MVHYLSVLHWFRPPKSNIDLQVVSPSEMGDRFPGTGEVLLADGSSGWRLCSLTSLKQCLHRVGLIVEALNAMQLVVELIRSAGAVLQSTHGQCTRSNWSHPMLLV